MVFSSSWILPLKLFFISAGVLSMALFFKTSVMDFSVSRAPVIWSSFLSWLKPPYLYLVINCIIIIIVASSRFYKNDEVETSSSQPPPDVEYEMKVKSDFRSLVYEQQLRDVDYEMKVNSDFGSVVCDEEEPLKVEETEASPVFEEKSIVVSGTAEVGYEDDTWTPPIRTDSSEILMEYDLVAEKSLVSARFGHRKPVKTRPGPEGGKGKALRVTKPKQHETLENTWKTITEGRAMPSTRHSKKSETWENHGHQINLDPSPVKKLETFKDRTNNQLPPVNNSPISAGKLRKEASLSQDELNRQVEAFIKKFNDEMRLQRQESLRQYQEMISRGV